MRIVCLPAIGVAALAAISLSPAASAKEPAIKLEARSLALSEQPGAEHVGGLRSLGMLVLPNRVFNQLRLSQLSGLAWDEDEDVLYAISDKGALFNLRPIFKGGRLVDVTVLRAAPLRNYPIGEKPPRWRGLDPEGLDVVNARNGRRGDSELLVSFERSARVLRYRPDGTPIGEIALPPPLDDKANYADSNQMLEAVCRHRQHGVLLAPEAPLADEPKGGTRIFSATGRSWRYPLNEGFLISAIECLDDGRLLVLERDFGRRLTRALVALRLVTLPSEPDTAARVSEVAVLDTGLGHRLDNFEGLTHHRANRYFMISDNNDLFFQQTLLLYFEIVPLAIPKE